MKKPLMLCILGPTASGKSGLAIEFAKKYNGEVISADSMQIYKEFNIGTAKILPEEMQGIAHHMLDIVEPYGNYSVADYCKNADYIANLILRKEKLPILAGGTGLYINSFTDNIKFFDYSKDEDYSNYLSELLNDNGPEFLWDMLFEADPKLAQTLSPNNVKRIKHALEVYRVTGKTYEQLSAESRQEPHFRTIKIGLRYSNRELLYERINKRVDAMLEKGLLDEVKHLLSIGVPEYSQAMNGIGYKEIVGYLNGHYTFEDAVEQIKQNSRRYAKRQMTWFRRDESVNWIDVDLTDNLFEEADKIYNINKN